MGRFTIGLEKGYSPKIILNEIPNSSVLESDISTEVISPEVLESVNIVYVDKIVEIEKPVEVIKYVDRIVEVPVEVIKEVIVEKIVEKEVIQYVDKHIEVTKEVPVDVVRFIDKIETKFRTPSLVWGVLIIQAMALVAMLLK